MDKESATHAEHVLDLFTEALYEINTLRPLKEVGAEITPSLAQELQFLWQHEVCSIREIAQGLSMTYSAASQLTDRLVRRGLVTRCENKRDRRLSEIRLTDDGRGLVEQIRLRRAEGISKVFDRLDESSRRNLIENLERFVSAAIDDEKSALEMCSHCGRDHRSECVVNEAYKAATGSPMKQI